VFKKDKDKKPFILAIPDFRKSGVHVSIKGWVYGEDAKQKEYWRQSDVNCYWVPQSDLRPINDLTKKLSTYA